MGEVACAVWVSDSVLEGHRVRGIIRCYLGVRGPDCAAYEPRVAHDTNLLSILYLRERSELVDDDVDVARAAVIAPLGGGAHSFGVGDRDRAAARWGWGRGALL